MIGPFTFERHAELDSTNLEAMRRGHAGAMDLAIVADRQSTGRGRHGRDWISPSGNLFLSLLVQPDIAVCRLGELAFVSALAAADAIASFAPKVALKWPNDILLGGDKVGGILIENEISCDRALWSVVGIGINIASKPNDTRYPATCLADHGAICSRDELAEAIATAFVERCDQWLGQGFAAIRADWMQRAWNLGAPIAIETDAANITGKFDGIDESGALLVAGQRVLSGTLSYRESA